MFEDTTKYRMLLFLGVLGFALSVLAGLAEHVEWLRSLCLGLSGSCGDALNVTLVRIPVWGWGLGFYALLAVCALWARGGLIWLVAGAVGVELSLVWLMVSMHWVCVFCIGNAVVLFLILLFSFESRRFWQTLSICLLLFLVSFQLIPHEKERQVSAETVVDPPEEVAATLSGESITQEELTAPLMGRIHDLELDIYRLKRERLEEMITERVLQKEAAQRGIGPSELVKDEVLSKGVDVSDEEVQRYYEENRSRATDWKGTQEELKGRMRAVLEQQKAYQKVLDYAKSLYPKYGVTILLQEPPAPLIRADVGASPAIGPADAPVTVIEFSDYQCPACRKVHPVVLQVRELYKGKIRWVFKDFPLKMHKDAERAAQAAHCAQEQGKYWDYQDLLYGSKEDLTAERLIAFAGSLGMAKEQFQSCLETGKYKDLVEQEIEAARKIGVDRTPTFVINGHLVTGGLALDRFKQLIDEELKKAGKLP